MDDSSILYKKVAHAILLLAISFVLSVMVFYISKDFDQRYFKYDSWGYYIYLPSFFIYHDALHLRHIGAIMWQYDISHEFFQALTLPSGNNVFGYTGGVALMELPFFITAHLLAHLFHFTTDGYSPIYQIFIICSGVFWGLSGLRYCYEFLRLQFSSSIALISCGCILLATNLFNYLFWENGMTHVYSFFLFSLAINHASHFFARPSYYRACTIGLALGMIILIRPTNIVMGLPLFFVGLEFSLGSVVARFRFCILHYRYLLSAGLILLLPFGLQMIYWHWATGHFLFNTYQYVGLGFDFLHPHLVAGWVGIHKGLFVYCPVLLIAILGLFFFHTKKPLIPNAAILLYLVVNSWIVYSWAVYDYGGCYGARALIDCYAIFTIPLAMSLTKIFDHKKWKWLTIVFIAFCIIDNQFQTWKYEKGYLAVTGYSTRDFLKSYLNYDHYQISPTLSAKLNHNELAKEKIIDVSKPQILDNIQSYSENIVLPIREIRSQWSDYIVRLEIVGRYNHLDILRGKRPVSIIYSQENKGTSYSWRNKIIYAQTIIGDTAPQRVIFDTHITAPFSNDDVIKCYVMNASSNQFLLDSFKLYLVRK